MLEQDLLLLSSSLLLSSLESSDTKVYDPVIRALLGTAAHFCKVDGGDQLHVRFARRGEEVGVEAHHLCGQSIFIALMTSGRELQASREGSK